MHAAKTKKTLHRVQYNLQFDGAQDKKRIDFFTDNFLPQPRWRVKCGLARSRWVVVPRGRPGDPVRMEEIQLQHADLDREAGQRIRNTQHQEPALPDTQEIRIGGDGTSRRYCEQRSGRGERRPPETGRCRHRPTLRAAPERGGRQGHDRLPHPEALKIRDDLAFFQAIKARFAKFDDQTKTRTNEEIETAIRQIVNDAIISSEVIDVFDAAGIKKPDISILSDEFLADIQGMGRKNLALELLKRLLNDEIKTRSKMNLVQGRKFSEMLAEAVKRYQNGLIDSARLIAELIQLAKDLRAADRRGEKMNLRPDEMAFFDALADNPTAEAVLGDQTLKQIAYELVEKVRQNTSIDWQHKASVQAQLRVLVKRILRKYKYPPDDPATGEYTVSVTKVLDQAELLADYWMKSK